MYEGQFIFTQLVSHMRGKPFINAYLATRETTEQGIRMCATMATQ